jgi:hypothetical protein
MLYMIVERFNGADPDAVGARFRQRRRMLPEGVTYQASWVAASGERCFQLMECRDEESLGA